MHSTRLWAAKTTRLHRTRRGSHVAEHRAVGGRGRARPRYASRGGGWCAARPHLLQRWVFRLSSVSIWAASHAHSDTPQQRNVACGRRECGSPSRRGSACTQVTLRLALWRGGTAGGHPGCMVRHPAPVVEPALPAVSATPHSLCTATIIDTPRPPQYIFSAQVRPLGCKLGCTRRSNPCQRRVQLSHYHAVCYMAGVQGFEPQCTDPEAESHLER